MTVSLNTNIASLTAQRALRLNSQNLRERFQRLSTGLRINRAVDDAAGLAIADGLRADTRIANTAKRNALDGISTIQVADGGLQEIGNILTRMAELAEQAANGINNTETRSPLDAEFVALAQEITRIAQTTEFNDIRLLSGGENINLQVGLNGNSDSQITVFGVEGTLQRLGLGDAGENLQHSLNGTTDEEGKLNALTALAAVNDAIGELSQQRGMLGATESRLESALGNLTSSAENFKAAESQIRDADIAVEAAQLTRLQILQDTTTAILAQANQQPSLVRALLDIL